MSAQSFSLSMRAAPEAEALRNDKQIAVKAMDEARGLADAGQKSAKPPERHSRDQRRAVGGGARPPAFIS